MYIPSPFRSPCAEAERQLMREHPLATLVWSDAEGLQATPLPLLLREDGERLVLAAHLPRANPLVQRLQQGEAALLAVFRGPDVYVSPNWLPSKHETHRQVPTWNYATVHAHGLARLIDDPEWVRAQMAELTARHEAGEPKPWSLDDAPPEFTAQLLRVLVGLELRVARLEGKFKLSQNKDARDRTGILTALRAHPVGSLMEA